MATYLNPALIANSVPEPQPVQSPLQLSEGVARVRQLQQQGQQQAALAPIQQQQAQATLEETQARAHQLTQQQKDQEAFGVAMRDSGGDPDKLEAMAAQTITDPYTLSRVQQAASTIRAHNAETTFKQHQQTAELHGQYEAHVQSVIDALDAGDTARATKLWNAVATQGMNEKDPTGQNTLPPGTIDPNTVPTKETLQGIQTWLSGSKDYQANQAKIKEANALAAANATKAQVGQRQAAREDIADKYQSVSNPEQHQAFLDWLQKTHPEVAGEYADLPFDPENTPDAVERMALTAQQRATNEYKGRMADAAIARASVAGGRYGAFARANDPTLTDAQRRQNEAALEEYDKANGGASPNAQLIQQRYLQKRADTDSKLHSTLAQQEQDQWTLRGRYGDILKQAGISSDTKDPDTLSTTVKDPKTGRDITAGEAMQLMEASKAKATELGNQQKEIRKREQWGEFAPAQPAAPATTAGGQTKSAGLSLPRYAIPDFAAKNKMTVPQAEAALKQKGYGIDESQTVAPRKKTTAPAPSTGPASDATQ
jgi:hypothetical protein